MTPPHREAIVMVGLKPTMVPPDDRAAAASVARRRHGAAPPRAIRRRTAALPAVGIVALARSLGAEAWQVASLAEREEALEASRARAVTRVIRVDTDAGPSTGAGGSWRDAAVPDVSARRQVEAARDHLEANSAAGAPASERP